VWIFHTTVRLFKVARFSSKDSERLGSEVAYELVPGLRRLKRLSRSPL
jgi:hypothetical protein